MRRWAPTALNAVVALVPAGALLSAVGAAGSGYLLHRADVAAAGAGTAAVGLAVERLQNRSLRQRARRERWEWRAEREQLRDSMDELRRDLADAHHTLTVLRSRIHTLHERTATADPRPGLTELAARQRLGRPLVVDDAPTMPLRRIGAPLAGTPLAASPLAGPSVPLAPLATRPVAAAPTPATGPLPLVGGPLPANPLRRKTFAPAPAVRPAAAAPVAPVTPGGPVAPVPGGPVAPVPGGPVAPVPGGARPTPAEPERRRPLVTLGRGQAAAGGEGWSAFEPAGGHPPVTAGPARPAAHHATAGRRRAAAEAGTVAPQEFSRPMATPLPGSGQPPIALGPLATPPHLPGLPPGPRDPVSGPLAILVDLHREQARPASSVMPPATVDAMVWASMAEAEADELTAVVERLGDPDRGGRHGGATPGEARPSGLVVVGAGVVGDPEARARRGRHTA